MTCPTPRATADIASHRKGGGVRQKQGGVALAW